MSADWSVREPLALRRLACNTSFCTPKRRERRTVSLSDHQSDVRHPGVMTPISWCYIALGVALLCACFLGGNVAGVRLQPEDAWFPGLLVVGAIGTILRQPWGRWLSYVFSILMLPGVPIGTIIGGLMIYHLTIYRDQFRWSSRASSA